MQPCGIADAVTDGPKNAETNTMNEITIMANLHFLIVLAPLLRSVLPHGPELNAVLYVQHCSSLWTILDRLRQGLLTLRHRPADRPQRLSL